MKLLGHYKDCSYDEKGNINLSFSLFGQEVPKAKKLIARLMKKDNLLDVEVKEHKNKRSLDANGYAWVLINNLARHKGIPSLDQYREFIVDPELNIFQIYQVSNNAVETEKKSWTMLGKGWIVEELDYTETLTTLKRYYGTSVYNTKQMSRFINIIVNECKLNGIETKTPQELAELNSQWAKEK